MQTYNELYYYLNSNQESKSNFSLKLFCIYFDFKKIIYKVMSDAYLMPNFIIISTLDHEMYHVNYCAKRIIILNAGGNEQN
jgi:hypothetical protein